MRSSEREILKRKAISLRFDGYSYSYIISELGLPKSTLSDWLKDITFVPNQLTIDKIRFGTEKSAKNRHQRKLDDVTYIKQDAYKEVGELTKRDLFLFGIGLYLGEGGKAIESVRVINSDSRVIKIAIKWFTEVVGLRMSNLILSLHSYPDNNIHEDIEYWSKISGIPKVQFGKTQIDKRVGKRIGNKLPHGTVQLRVVANGEKKFGVSLHRRIMGWIDAVSEKTDHLV